MRVRNKAFYAVSGCTLFMLLAGSECLQPDGQDDNGNDSPEINVQFLLSAKVETSIGSGLNGARVKFQADKFYWDDYEGEWQLRRSYNQTQSTMTIGAESGVTPTWQMGYNLHKGETVFLTATELETGNKQQAKVTYAQARASAGSSNITAVTHRFVLVGGV